MNAVVFKREAATNHGVKNDTSAPHIGGFCVGVSLDHFGSGVRGGSAGASHVGASFCEFAAEAEVDESDASVAAEEDVLGFEVAMGNEFFVVEVVKSANEFGEVSACLFFGEAPLVVNVFKH